MVVTFLPATVEIGVVQDRVGCPLIWTVQAPHRAMPQPNLVPVSPSVSRRTHSSGICGVTSTLCRFPFNVKSIGIKPSCRRGLHARVQVPSEIVRPHQLNIRLILPAVPVVL